MLKRNELRKEEIQNKIVKTMDIIESIKKIIPKEFEEFKKDDIIKDAIYKRIESSIQNLVDVCYIINSDLRLGMPEVEDDIIEHIEKNKILSKKSVDILRKMKQFRNILVHRYGDVNDKQAFENIKEGLKDFELVIKEIENFLKKHK